jgi:hypothetical protein
MMYLFCTTKMPIIKGLMKQYIPVFIISQKVSLLAKVELILNQTGAKNVYMLVLFAFFVTENIILYGE